MSEQNKQPRRFVLAGISFKSIGKKYALEEIPTSGIGSPAVWDGQPIGRIEDKPTPGDVLKKLQKEGEKQRGKGAVGNANITPLKTLETK